MRFASFFPVDLSPLERKLAKRTLLGSALAPLFGDLRESEKLPEIKPPSYYATYKCSLSFLDEIQLQ